MGTTNWIARVTAAGACAAALLSAPAHAANASIYVQVAPPPPQYEVVPAPRRHQAWVPGHWEWHRGQHVWVAGRFERVRPGYAYAQPQWVQDGDRWGYHPGGWHAGGRPGHGHWQHGHGRDRDRDGIPDRRDRDLDNDGRPNHRDRDRDGDGVRNRDDRAPDNRWRN